MASLLIPDQSAFILFFFNDTATTEIYTLSLHDALPISNWVSSYKVAYLRRRCSWAMRSSAIQRHSSGDRKSTRLNSSHVKNSYAVFCLKKKKRIHTAFQENNEEQPRGAGPKNVRSRRFFF